jgi:hypothetical protein
MGRSLVRSTVVAACGLVTLAGCGSSPSGSGPSTTAPSASLTSYCAAVKRAAAAFPDSGAADPGLTRLLAFSAALNLVVPHAPASQRAFWLAESGAVAAVAHGGAPSQTQVAGAQEGIAGVIKEVKADCRLDIRPWAA